MKPHQNSNETAGAVAPATPCSVLFVGGHADGKRVNLPKLHPAIKSAVEKPRTPETTAAFQSYEIGEEIHTLRRWRSNDTDHTLYMLDGMSDAETMGRLLEHYRPNTPAQQPR